MEDSTNIPDLTGIAEVSKTLPAVWTTLSDIHKVVINRDGFLYACAYEVRLNLSLIAALNEEKLSELKLDSPVIKELVSRFQISATLALLTGNDRKNHRRLIKLLSNLTVESKLFENDNDNENDNEAPNPVTNAIEAMNFVVNKIETLRIIAGVYNEEQNVFRKINIVTRLKNIEKALIAVQKQLKKAIDKDQKQLMKKSWFCF